MDTKHRKKSCASHHLGAAVERTFDKVNTCHAH